jgi:FMN phosphatase YigB (HAD superfamily)
MKPILAIDLEGALLKSRPFEKAHKDWFKIFSSLLKDENINNFAEKKDYYKHVYEVMEKYLGRVPKETQNHYARTLYSMCIISETKEEDIIVEFAKLLSRIKDKYTLALITTAPEPSVKGILEKFPFLNSFEIVFASPIKREPNKKQLFEEFMEKYEKPLYYIGDGDKTMETCKLLNIKTIAVNWIRKSDFKGDFNVNTVDELKEILNQNP